MELVPKRVVVDLKEVLDPVSPDLTDSIIKFMVSELKRLFRELSEHRSMTEGKARLILSEYQNDLLAKLEDELPNLEAQVQRAYELLNEVLVKRFEEQKGKKFL